MSGSPSVEASRQAVLALMRQGLSDDAIAKRTGLSLMQILELRAAASVQDRRPRPQPGG